MVSIELASIRCPIAVLSPGCSTVPVVASLVVETDEVVMTDYATLLRRPLTLARRSLDRIFAQGLLTLGLHPFGAEAAICSPTGCRPGMSGCQCGSDRDYRGAPRSRGHQASLTSTETLTGVSFLDYAWTCFPIMSFVRSALTRRTGK